MNGTRFIVAGSFVDGSAANVRKNVFLTVKKGIITAIDPAVHLPRNDRDAIEDFSHCTILPPLVDCSVHLLRSPSVDGREQRSTENAGPAEKLAMLERHIRYCHAHGVLGVVDSDEIASLLDLYQKRKGEGSNIDIRIPGHLFSGNQDCGPGASGDGDFLRIGYSSNIEDEEGLGPRLEQENLYRLLQNRDLKKTVVVANGSRQVEEALEADCDAIEQGYGMGEANLREMAKKGVLWIPSVLRAKNALDGAGSCGDVSCRFSQRYVAPGKPVPGAETFWKKMLADQLSQMRLARRFGVTTAVGTGAGSMGILHGESMVEEMKLFIKAGYSLEETIRCASQTGAEFFGMKELGTLTVGRKATFLVARGTVKQLPRKLSYLEGIYVAGRPSIAYRKHP
ncbi:amidohydrolase family protein [Desulfopila inferna]|uniref:amidohydrolase family protein n=1 Tax=Desulfopila inferna TaxID=468528 RepID=UPI001964CE81|nr:amidohydrolase family protein [Desulfopila inferna]MBM9603111.1 amidohydrolase family protein [Desulfopila inferna]